MSTAPAAPARIGKIVVRDFRAFHGNETYTLPLDGKNLLLFGENGSGKSSLFHALRTLLSDTAPPKPYADYRNIYTEADEGTVTIELATTPPTDMRWEYEGEHPASDTTNVQFFEIARRATFLDYKALLKVHFVHENKKLIDLFDLLVNDLLRHAEYTDGTTFKQKWHALCHFQPSMAPVPEPDEDQDADEWPSAQEQLNDRTQEFKSQFDGFLNGPSGLVTRANTLLATLSPGLTIQLTPGTFNPKVASQAPDSQPHTIEDETICLTAQFADKTIAHPALFFNEARLTAIALSLYLAAAQLAIPAGPSNAARLLVLDDVLIGLDFANRLPFLKLLSEQFGDWQIILMTFDRVWFELAKEFTEFDGRWRSCVLREFREHPQQPGRPIVEGPKEMLECAKGHLQAGDLMAAAVYTRAAFENRIKNVCVKYGIEVRYKKDAKEHKADDLWTAICKRQEQRQSNTDADFIDPALQKDVEAVRSTILNRLSHSGVPSFETSEVQTALDAIEKLQIHEFKKSTKK